MIKLAPGTHAAQTGPAAALRPESVQPSQLLHRLLGGRLAAFECRAAVDAATLHPLERADIAGAAGKRVGDFTAGRACARAALEALTMSGFALRMGADREPLWPAGFIGSITHTAGFCAAAVAATDAALSLGIDAETRDAVHPRLWNHICTARERAWLAGLEPATAVTCATVIFSAKESFYKCQHPLTHQWLNFGDVSVNVRDDGFDIVPERPLHLSGFSAAPWQGRFALDAGLVVTGMRL